MQAAMAKANAGQASEGKQSLQCRHTQGVIILCNVLRALDTHASRSE